jgi:Ca-activated chloride channel family protein
MSDFRFESAFALRFLFLIPLMYLLYVLFAKKLEKRLNLFLGVRLKPMLTSSISFTKRKWKFYLELCILTLMIIAYARPQSGEGRQKIKNEGVELVFLVDVSNSMLAEDIRPSRLEFAKSELIRLIEMSTGNRIGIVAFANSAVLLSPLTTDQDALKMYIDSLSPDVVSTQGTNFTRALDEVRDAFHRGGASEDTVTSVTRAIIIASDGEDQEEGAIKTAQKLVDEGIHIFTLGFGTTEGGAIPVHDAQGVLRGYKRDKSGQVIMSKTQGTVLKDLARMGQGSFHHASFQGDAIAALQKDLLELKRTQFESGEVRSYNEHFQFILFLAFLFAVLELWLGERKLQGRIWKGRFEVSND